MDKKYLVSDIDGTLLQHGQIEPETKAKVKNFVKEGNVLVLASGRVKCDIIEIEKLLGVSAECKVSQNGMILYDKKNDLLLYNQIENSLLKNLFDYIFSLKDIEFEVNTKDYRYMEKLRNKEFYSEYVDHSGTKIDNKLREYAHTLQVTVVAILCANDDLLYKVDAHIRMQFKGLLQVVTTYSGIIEIFSAACSKGDALQWLQVKYNWIHENIYVVGDNYNDLTMLQMFQENAFAMDTAEKPIKMAAANKIVKYVGDVIDIINQKSL